MNITTRHYRSLREFVDYANGTRKNGSSSQSGSESFTGTKSYADAEKIAFRWDEGAADIEKIAARISLGIQRPEKINVRSFNAPGVLMMGQYVSGHPRPYVARRRTNDMQRASGKVIRVIVNPAASCGVDKAVLRTRGAAVLALVSALEKKGQRVELSLAFSTRSSAAVEYWVTLKSAATRTNLNSVAFAVAHPSMLRRIIFSAMECDPKGKSFGAGGGYGSPRNVTVNEEDIYLPSAGGWESQWQSEDAATEWVRDMLTERGLIAA